MFELQTFFNAMVTRRARHFFFNRSGEVSKKHGIWVSIFLRNSGEMPQELRKQRAISVGFLQNPTFHAVCAIEISTVRQ